MRQGAESGERHRLVPMVERAVIATLAVQYRDRHRRQDVDAGEHEDALEGGPLDDEAGKYYDRRELDQEALDCPLRGRIEVAHEGSFAAMWLGAHHGWGVRSPINGRVQPRSCGTITISPSIVSQSVAGAASQLCRAKRTAASISAKSPRRRLPAVT